jgi:hypothetical protein
LYLELGWQGSLRSIRRKEYEAMVPCFR